MAGPVRQSPQWFGIDWGGRGLDEYDVVSSSSTDTTLPARKRVHISSDSEVDVSFMSEFLETEYEHFDEYAARQEILASHTR